MADITGTHGLASAKARSVKTPAPAVYCVFTIDSFSSSFHLFPTPPSFLPLPLVFWREGVLVGFLKRTWEGEVLFHLTLTAHHERKAGQEVKLRQRLM